MKLGMKLISFLLVLSLVPIAVITGISVYNSTDLAGTAEDESAHALDKKMEENMVNEISAKQEELQFYIDEREVDAKTLTQLHAMVRYLDAVDTNDTVGNTLGKGELVTSVESWSQSINTYFKERELDAKSLGSSSEISNYFAALKGEDSVTNQVVLPMIQATNGRTAQVMEKNVETHRNYVNEWSSNYRPLIKSVLSDMKNYGIEDPENKTNYIPGEYSANYTTLKNAFFDIADRFPEMDMIRLFYENGDILCGVKLGVNDSSDYKGDKGWFSDIMNPAIYDEGDMFTSAISIARATNSPAIRFGTPFDVDGERLGLMIVNFAAGPAITNDIAIAIPELEGDTYVVDKDYRNAEGETLTHTVILDKPTDDDFYYIEEGDEYAFEVTPDQLTGSSGYVVYDKNGTQYSAVYNKLNVDGKGWYVISSILSNALYDIAASESLNDIRFHFTEFQKNKLIDVGNETIDLYCHLTLTDEFGREIVMTEEGTDVTDTSRTHSSEDWFTKAVSLNEGDTYFGHPVAETMENGEVEDMIHISSPIYYDGEFAGVVDLRSHYFIVSKMIEDVRFGETGYMYIVDERGWLVSHPKYSIADEFDATDVTVVGEKLANIVSNMMLQGKSGIDRYTFEEVDKYVAYAPFNAGHRQFTIATTIPVKELNKLPLLEAEKALENAFIGFELMKLITIGENTKDLYHSIVFIDENGNELISATEGEASTDRIRSYGSESWFQKGTELASGQVYFSEIIVNNDGEDMMRIITPIDYNGVRRGYISMNMHYFMISDIIAQVTIGETGYLYIINEEGILTSHPTYKYADGKDLSDASNGEELANIVSGHMTAGNSGFDEYSFEGVTKFVSYAPINFGDKQYSIAATMPKAEAEKEAHELASTLQEKSNVSLIMSIIVAIIAAVVVALVGFLISRSITKPIVKLSEVSKKLAEGDFNVELDIKKSKDEVGEMVQAYSDMLDNTSGPLQEINEASAAIANGDLTRKVDIKAKGDIGKIAGSFKKMQENLKGLVKDIQKASTDVASISQEMASMTEEMNASTEQVSAAITQISEGAQQQAQNATDTTMALQEMLNSVEEVANSSNLSAETAMRTNEFSKKGRDTVQKTVQKMSEIQTVVLESANTIEDLSKKSTEIVQIVDVITDITDQTTLLALNAAIEAARAGEQGRGFAVVADEVKKLAENSRESAENIAKMIKEIETETQKAVEAMRKGTAAVEEGMSSIQETDTALGEIANMAEDTSGKVQEISAATQLQRAGAEEAVGAMETIASVAEESASSTEESSASTEELTASMEELTARAQDLSEMAISLQESAGRFRLDKDGKTLKKTLKKSGE